MFAAGGKLTKPSALIFGPDGNLYVNSQGTKRAAIRREDGDASWCLRGRAGTAAAIGLVFGPDGNLYVASHGPNPVLRYDGVTGVLIDIL